MREKEDTSWPEVSKMRNSTSAGSVSWKEKETACRRAGFGKTTSEPLTSGPAAGSGASGVASAASAELRPASPPNIVQEVATGSPAVPGRA